MSDMYGPIRSNAFRVKNPEAFKAWFAKYSWPYEVEVFSEGGDKLAFGNPSIPYPNAVPQVDVIEDGHVMDTVEVDIHEFARELREHLLPGEFLHVVAGGAEKIIYVGFSVLTITHEHVAHFDMGVYGDMKLAELAPFIAANELKPE